MRTENQIRRKLNELLMQKKWLESRLTESPSTANAPSLQLELERLDDQILLLEWVLNAPEGSYHAPV